MQQAQTAPAPVANDEDCGACGHPLRHHHAAVAMMPGVRATLMCAEWACRCDIPAKDGAR